MAFPVIGNRRRDLLIGDGPDVVGTEVARIGQHPLRPANRRGLRLKLLQRRLHLALVVGLLRHMPGDDQTTVGVHARLCVVALLKATA